MVAPLGRSTFNRKVVLGKGLLKGRRLTHVSARNKAGDESDLMGPKPLVYLRLGVDGIVNSIPVIFQECTPVVIQVVGDIALPTAACGRPSTVARNAHEERVCWLRCCTRRCAGFFNDLVHGTTEIICVWANDLQCCLSKDDKDKYEGELYRSGNIVGISGKGPYPHTLSAQTFP